MPIFCRGCSDTIDADTSKPLRDFPTQSKTHVFDNVLAAGMERFCIACRRSGRLQNIANEMINEPTPSNATDYMEKESD